jgi:hypothetical protein
MLRMSGLGRNKSSGAWTARKAIPETIRDAYAVAFGPAWEEKFSRPASLSEREVRVAYAD